MTGATKNTASAPPTSVKSAITSDVPIGNVGAMPEPPGAGVHPSGDAMARRFAAEIHSAIGAASINRPLAITRLELAYPYESAPPTLARRKRNHASTLPQIAVSIASRMIHFG